MKRIQNILTGVDAELFLQHKESKEIISAEGIIQGTKEKPFVFDADNKFFATSLDNVLAEFNIPPASNKLEFYNYLRKSMNYIERTIPEELCTAIVPAWSLNDKWLQTEHSQIFGCEPDYNAYTGQQNIKPQAQDKNLRSAGLHTHLSYDEVDTTINMNIVKALDLFVAIPSVIMEPENDRKKLYGKAGAFRHKTYGVEYRTLSNFYLQSKDLIMWLYDQIMAAISWLNSGGEVNAIYSQYIADTININDRFSAKEIINKFNLKVL